jgi:hypothetical protein
MNEAFRGANGGECKQVAKPPAGRRDGDGSGILPVLASNRIGWQARESSSAVVTASTHLSLREKRGSTISDIKRKSTVAAGTERKRVCRHHA